MKTCLVLGAGGFMGKALCKRLVADYKVIAFDKYCPKELCSLDNLRLVQGDFVNTTDFSELVCGVDVIIHLISTTIPEEGTAHLEKEIVENVIPTIRLFEAAAKSRVSEIIFSSSGGTVYGETGDRINRVADNLNPVCSYGLQKKTIESFLQLYGTIYGINYKIMRIANPYGMGQDPEKPQGVIPIFIRRLLCGKEISVLGDGNDVRDYIYIDDLVDSFVSVLKYRGQQNIFNIATGKVHSLNQVIELIEKKASMKFSNITYKNAKNCNVHKSLLEVETSWKELEWCPEVSLESGIDILLKYYKN